jgi:putative ABC transport system substrate-binding protein
VRRREFITLLGGAAAWPLAARAQQPERMRRIGIVMPFAKGDSEGEATGIAWLALKLEAKRLGLLHELVPQARPVGVLLNPSFQPAEGQLSDLQEAARTIGLPLHVLRAGTDRDIDAAFESVAQHRIPALLVASDPFFEQRSDKLVALAARHAVPVIYDTRHSSMVGGLMSYGPSFSDAVRQVGIYTGRILKGDKPADLPVMQPTKFELVINLKTAKALGLEVPPQLLARADEVIE